MHFFLLRLSLILLCVFSGAAGSSAQTTSAASRTDLGYQDMAAVGTETLQEWYLPANGLWETTGWWNAANALTVLVDYSRLSGSTSYQSAIANTYARNAAGGFLNKYYDDEGWWALAWIDAYDWSGDTKYLNTASSIFEDMTLGWDDVCGGGVWWSKDKTYKNAIANELFLSVAAHLANRVADSDEQAKQLAWAEQEWQWFSQSGMINSQDLINDGLDSSCRNNQKTTWTYNQGVILGGLVELYQQDQDVSLPDAAQAIASAAITELTDENGVLHDRCEPNCGRDGVQFKGIFLRNLAALNQSFPQTQYMSFAEINAQSIWNNDQGSDYQFGQIWSGPFDTGDAARQSCALDALIAAAEMDRLQPQTPALGAHRLSPWPARTYLPQFTERPRPRWFWPRWPP